MWAREETSLCKEDNVEGFWSKLDYYARAWAKKNIFLGYASSQKGLSPTLQEKRFYVSMEVSFLKINFFKCVWPKELRGRSCEERDVNSTIRLTQEVCGSHY